MKAAILLFYPLTALAVLPLGLFLVEMNAYNSVLMHSSTKTVGYNWVQLKDGNQACFQERSQ
jgi:hypothetical protein